MSRNKKTMGGAAAVMVAVTAVCGSSARAQQVYGPWSYSNGFVGARMIYVSPGGAGLQDGTTPQNAMPTIGAALASAATTQPAAVTINCAPGTYSQETFPLQMPSQRIALEAYPTNGSTGLVVVDAPASASTPASLIEISNLVQLIPGTPWSEVRGITFRIDTGQAGIRIAAAGDASTTEGGEFYPSQVLIQDCTFLTQGNSNTRGVVVAPSGAFGNPRASEARIVSSVFDGGPGSPGSIAIEDVPNMAFGGTMASSTLVLANKICAFGEGIVTLANAGASMRPRIQSNIVQQCTTGLRLTNVNALVVANTIANGNLAGGGATVIQGVAITNGVHEISNNIVWNRPRAGSPAVDFTGSSAGASGVANTYLNPPVFEQVANLAVPPVFVGWSGNGQPTTGCVDLHLVATSALRGLGNLAAVGTAVAGFQVVPMPGGPPPIPGTVWTVRRDLSIDVDDDPRITNRTGPLVTDVGADQVHFMRLSPSASGLPFPVDEFGNLLAQTGTPTTNNTFGTTLLMTGVPANTLIAPYLGFGFFEQSNGLDNGILHQNLVPASGSLRVGLLNTESIALPLLNTTAGGTVSIPLSLGTWGPNVCHEVEVYVQAVTLTGSLLSTTNRQRIELNWR